jgi:hypothetical protein
MDNVSGYIPHMLMFLGGVYIGMTIMACMVAAGRADKVLESAAPDCCNHDCNQGDDCPLRRDAA